MTKTLEEWQEIQAQKLEQAWTKIAKLIREKASLQRALDAANKRNDDLQRDDLQRLLDQERQKTSEADKVFRGLE